MKQKKESKNNLVSARVSREVYESLKHYGEVLHLGTKNGSCVLVSLGATIIYKILKSVENDLELYGKSMKDFYELKERWFYKPQIAPFMDIIKDKNITSDLPEEIIFEIFKIKTNKSKKEEKI